MLPIDKKPEEIQELLGHSSYVSEGYGLYKENIITYSESEDGAAEINGKLLELDGSQEIRTRYLTPYNFLIAPKGSSINLSHEDINIRCILDGILNGTKSFNELNEFILDLPKPFF
jgi:hypothetical protein